MSDFSINKIEISGYRSIENVSINLYKNRAILVGKNGAGKSNILAAIALISRQSVHRRRYRTGRSPDGEIGRVSFHLNVGGKDRVFSVESIYAQGEDGGEEIMDQKFVFSDGGAKGERQIKSRKMEMKVPTEYYQEIIDYPDIISYMAKEGAIEIGSPEARRIFMQDKSFHREYIKIFNSVTFLQASVFTRPHMCPPSFQVNDNTYMLPMGGRSDHLKFLRDLYSLSRENRSLFDRYKEAMGREHLGVVDDIKFKVVRLPVSKAKVLPGGKFKRHREHQEVVIPYVKKFRKSYSISQLSEGTYKILATVT